MRVVLFGATGMVGQGVLRECLRDPGVESVITVGRSPMGQQNPKLRDVVHGDFTDFSGIEADLKGRDACYFCLGVASSGMKEADYERVTYQFTLAAAETLSRLNPSMTFIYVSGSGTDSSERGRMMWARVKGRTENALLRLPLNAYMFRPGFIEPMDGIRSKTPMYQFFYTVTGPVLPLLRRMFPRQILSTRDIGRAMLAVSRKGYKSHVLEAKDIRAVVTVTP
jgi:uncharacterized protein YbjT (DUF2867 family)